MSAEPSILLITEMLRTPGGKTAEPRSLFRDGILLTPGRSGSRRPRRVAMDNRNGNF